MYLTTLINVPFCINVGYVSKIMMLSSNGSRQQYEEFAKEHRETPRNQVLPTLTCFIKAKHV